MRGWAWGLLLGLVLAPAAFPQSLGEAAAREKAKREKRGKATPTPSYTDSDLKDPNKPAGQNKEQDPNAPVQDPNAPAPSGAKNAGAGEGARPPTQRSSEGGGEGAGPPSVSAGDEAIWRGRAR